MNPYHITVEDNTVELYQLSDGRFQITKSGEFGDLLVGNNYVLVEKELGKYFKTIDIERVSYKNAIIWNRKTNTEYKNYIQIIVNHNFESGDINNLNIENKQFLLMSNCYLFVSPALKQVLEKSEFKFKYTEGLSQFA